MLKSSWNCRTPTIRGSHSTILLKLCCKMPLNKIRKLSLSLNLSLIRGPWQLQRGSNSLHLISGSLRHWFELAASSNKWKKELWGSLCCYEHIRKEKGSFCKQTDQVTFRDTCITTCTVVYVADDPDEPPTVQEEVALPKIVICLSFHIFRELSVRKNIYFSLVKRECLGKLFAF